MKRYLLIMRHAHSANGLNDFDRPLSKRGQEQARMIAEKLEKLQLKIDKLLVSSSVRTKETADLLKKSLISCPPPTLEQGLYNASLDEVLDTLLEIEDSSILLLIAHNPSVAMLAEYLGGQYHEFHPGSLAVLSTDAETLSQAIKARSFKLEHFIEADL